jgi:DNA-binding MarR family transcriptional regulator
VITGRHTADAILKARVRYWPAAATAVANLLVRLFRVSSLILENARRQIAAHGLTFAEFEILVTLRGVAPPHELAPTDLYSAVLISSGGLTKVLHALAQRKLIVRRENQTDRRSKPVRLTAKGCALAERAMADVLHSDGELVARGLSHREVERLTQLLRNLLTTLEPVQSG